MCFIGFFQNQSFREQHKLSFIGLSENLLDLLMISLNAFRSKFVGRRRTPNSTIELMKLAQNDE